MKILLLSAYDTSSHRYWREGLVTNFPQHEWTVLTLPARYFAWRLRGNSLSWAYTESEALNAPYDLLIATSMTDLSALRGMVPKLAVIPTLVYFHENQFAYPLSNEQKHSQVFNQSLNLYTALCADHIAFNSEYNRTTFLSSSRQFLKNMPDHVPDNLVEILEKKSSLLAVPLNDESFNIKGDYPHEKNNKSVRIAWAARWEYDKGPDRLLAVLRELEQRGTDYRLCIMGEKFRRVPEEFSVIQIEFQHRLDQFGYAETKEEYFQWLRASDIILATATHEFQGLSVLEAVASGCIPIVPNRLAYPELFDARYSYPDCRDDIQAEASGAVDMIEHHARFISNKNAPVPQLAQLSWSRMKAKYSGLIRELSGLE